MKKLRKLVFIFISLVMVLDLSFLYFFNLGLIFNISTSMPRGLYFIFPSKNIKRGDIVAACVDNEIIRRIVSKYNIHERGYCKNGLAVLKPYFAGEGDVISTNSSGVIINSHLTPHSKAIVGEKLINYDHFIINKNNIFLFSNYSDVSIDSRYFGAVSRSFIFGKAIRVSF